MKIAFDASMIDKNKAGIGYYAFNLLEELSKIDKENDYLIYTNRTENLSEIDFPENFIINEIPSENGNLKWMLKVLKDSKSKGIDALISPSNLFFGCLFPKTITVIHDLAQLKYPRYFNKKGNLLYRIEFNILLRREKIIVASSETIKKEILEYYPKANGKVFALGEGLHNWTKRDTTQVELEEIKTKYSLPENYFLSISTLEPRKNYPNAIRAFFRFLQKNPGWKYLIAGKKGWFFDEIYKTVKNLDLQKDVIFLGYVPDSDLPGLLDLSQGLVNLSYYEGFGLPLIEAYSRKKPVLASNIDVYKEVMESNALYVNPMNVSEAASGMERLKNFKTVLNREFLDKYSWKFVADGFVRAYKKLL